MLMSYLAIVLIGWVSLPVRYGLVTKSDGLVVLIRILQDLLDEAARLGEPACNFGLRDQRAAFLWIQKHISDFGGDAGEITAFGESAGSVSLWLHMCSTEPLFKRAALLSGTAVTCKPTDRTSLEKLYLELLDYCGIDKLDPDRLRRLREDVPVPKLLDAIDALRVGHFNPLAESTFFPEAPTYYNQANIVGRCKWIKEIIIGDTFFEVSVLHQCYFNSISNSNKTRGPFLLYL